MILRSFKPYWNSEFREMEHDEVIALKESLEQTSIWGGVVAIFRVGWRQYVAGLIVAVLALAVFVFSGIIFESASESEKKVYSIIAMLIYSLLHGLFLLKSKWEMIEQVMEKRRRLDLDLRDRQVEMIEIHVKPKLNDDQEIELNDQYHYLDTPIGPGAPNYGILMNCDYSKILLSLAPNSEVIFNMKILE